MAKHVFLGIFFTIWVIYGGWYALGFFGLGLLWGYLTK